MCVLIISLGVCLLKINLHIGDLASGQVAERLYSSIAKSTLCTLGIAGVYS